MSQLRDIERKQEDMNFLRNPVKLDDGWMVD